MNLTKLHFTDLIVHRVFEKRMWGNFLRKCEKVFEKKKKKKLLWPSERTSVERPDLCDGRRQSLREILIFPKTN